MALIAIVGSDGAGKSTVVQAVKAEIARFCSVSLVDKWDILDHGMFPEYRFLSTDLKTLRTCVAEMRDTNRTLFLFWALQGSLSPERLRQTEVVLLDGYWPKHAAAEIAYSAPPSLLDALISVMPRADLTILLDVDPEVAYARRASDPRTALVAYECGQSDCSKAGFIAHQSKIRASLLPWARDHGWTVIDANRPLDAVTADVVGSVTRHIGRSPA
jgi:thymidylate kinase